MSAREPRYTPVTPKPDPIDAIIFGIKIPAGSHGETHHLVHRSRGPEGSHRPFRAGPKPVTAASVAGTFATQQQAVERPLGTGREMTEAARLAS